jgi:L-iditol 2-dehydrogenase
MTGLTSAAVLTGAGRVELMEQEVGEPGDGEVLIRVSAVGLCGSDAHWYEEGSIGDAELGLGLVLGHELTGVIESGPRTGERVAVDPAIPCLACDPCRRHQQNLCSDLRFAGHGSTHGGLRGHLVWPERCLTTLPEVVSDEVGALLEPLGVAIHAVDLAGIDASMKVGVVGAGPIGLLTLMVLRARGVKRIVASEPLSHRRDVAESLGADVESGPLGDSALCDVVFDAAGTDTALATSLEAARPGGLVVAVGIPVGDRTTLAASVPRRKELTLRWCRRMDSGDLDRAASLAADRTEVLAGLVTHTYPMNAVDQAFDDLVTRRGVKVLVTPGASP